MMEEIKPHMAGWGRELKMSWSTQYFWAVTNPAWCLAAECKSGISDDGNSLP